MRTAGFVLVGGRSSRLGRDKALLPWRNQTLVESIAAKVREAAANVALVGRPELDPLVDIECIPDVRPGFGPLSGIEAAIQSGRGELNLIVACDLPLLESEWLKLLIHTADIKNAKCVLATEPAGRVHPLCGVYRADCLPVVSKALDEGQLKLMDLIAELRPEFVEVPVPIWNVNTPEEWQKCREFAHGR